MGALVGVMPSREAVIDGSVPDQASVVFSITTARQTGTSKNTWISWSVRVGDPRICDQRGISDPRDAWRQMGVRD